MTAYYNEFDPFAAEWLRQLIKAGHIADGVVDDRSILDVQPDDLKGFTQCHFFAGIGGWSVALRLASWPDTRPVWTGSPPCQPFSCAGLQLGKDDPRHLAPKWLELVKAGKPVAVFGEQVAAAVKKDNWLDSVLDELEAENYAAGATVLPACGIGAPHLRQRAWLVAKRLVDSIGPGLEGHDWHGNGIDQPGREQAQSTGSAGAAGRVNSLADSECNEQRERGGTRGEKSSRYESRAESSGCGEAGRMADSNSTAGRENTRSAFGNENENGGEGRDELETDSNNGHSSDGQNNFASPLYGSWAAADWLFCRDGKWRPVEPGTFPLANGVPNRVGKLRGYGNAIVPEVAAEVIAASMEIFEEMRQ